MNFVFVQDVHVYKCDSSENAKQKLWEAHAKRTVIRKTNENIMDHTSHLHDLVITFYWHEMSSNAIGTECAKVR